MRNRANLNKFFNRDRKTLYIVLSVLLLSVLTLTVVYAALSTTLNISGNAEVTAAGWDIHFDNIQVNPASVEAITVPKIIDSKRVDFSVGLNEPGDFYKFSVDIVNEGSIDAMIDSVVKTPELTAEQAKYIRYEIEYIDGNSISSKQLLSKGGIRTISILVAYRSDVSSTDIPTEGESLSLSFTMIYTQADETGTVVPEGAEVKVISGDYDTVGSEICIGEECFYLISSDETSVTMLAKYNLYVGNKRDDMNGVVKIENSTGIQNSTAIGWFEEYTEINPIIGNIEFASKNYWADSVSNYPAYVYDSNSTIYAYVENYRKHLENLGIFVEKARLISQEELIDLGCTIVDWSCTNSQYSWIYSTSYWTGTAGSDDYLRIVRTIGDFRRDVVCDNNLSLGIRPVIKIPITEF